MADHRALSPDTRLETDVLILDYLVFNGTLSLLEIARARVNDASESKSSRDSSDVAGDTYVPPILLDQLQLVECKK